jgi:internalin A
MNKEGLVTNRDLIKEAIVNDVEYLDLSNRGFSNFPRNIEKIRSLKKINLSNNNISYIPPEVVKLSNLYEIDLSNNSLKDLPNYFRQLENIVKIVLSRNYFDKVPDCLTGLLKLEYLDLSKNYIQNLDSKIGVFHNLKYLNLSNNLCSGLPIEVGRLINLETLDINNNNISEIPKTILNLQNLKIVELVKNPLEIPPLEIAVTGISGMRRYYKQIEEQDSDCIYEAKLVIVGEPGAGKTTLAQILRNHDYILQEEPSTEGIDVVDWSFKYKNNEKFKVNVWDFGGQEIYHSTHQFFLTKRSVYVIVADTRDQNTDFYFWLNIVSLLSAGSPVIIFNNEKQDRKKDIDSNHLKKRFANLKEVCNGNLLNKRGVDKLRNIIEHHIGMLPHIGSPLPRDWVKVRKILEADERNYISINEFNEICISHGFKERENKDQLLGYLHDLGVCLHFRDNILLNRIVILNPEWGTNAVYKVLDSVIVSNQNGSFNKKDLLSIWQDKEYYGVHDEMLNLMTKFKLCYQVPNNDGGYMAPQLLGSNAPKYNWPTQRSVNLTYTYEFMPKGLVSRFIVTMNSYIYHKKSVWRSGVIIKHDEAIAEIIEVYDRREIKIKISGKGRRDFLTIIDHEFDKIHSSFHGLEYHKMVPCNCDKCVSSDCKNVFKFNDLKKYLYLGVEWVPCVNSGACVNVVGLIDDVFDSRKFKKDMEDILPAHIFNISQIREVNMSNTKNYSGGNMTIGNDNVSTFEDNRFSIDHNINESISDEIVLLKKMVSALIQNDATADPEVISEDLDLFVYEASKEQPRKNRLNMSAEGIVEAAKAVGNAGIPIINCLEKILKLIA